MVLFAHVTSRVPGEKYPNLLQEKGGRGFPYLVYLNAEGDVVGKPSDRTVDAFKAGAASIQTWMDLKDKADLSKDEKVKLLVAKIELGKVDVAQAEKDKAAIDGLSADEAKSIDAVLVDLKVMEILKSANPQTPEAAAEVGKQMYEMHQKGLAPKGAQAFQPFYMLIMRYGQAQKDADIFEVGLSAMKEKYGHMKQAERFFNAQEKVLEQLRAGGK